MFDTTTFVHQRTLSHWDVFVNLRRRFLKISILGLKFSTPFENFNFNFEIFRSVCRKLSTFDKAGTDRDTISEPPLNLRDFCGRGAQVFSPQIFQKFILVVRLVLKLESLEFCCVVYCRYLTLIVNWIYAECFYSELHVILIINIDIIR